LGTSADDLGVDVELREIDRGYAVLLGEKLGKIFLGDGPSLDERIPQSGHPTFCSLLVRVGAAPAR